MKLLQSSTIFKQKKNHEVSNFCLKFFTIPNGKNIIATPSIVSIKKSKLTFLLILYFHDQGYTKDLFLLTPYVVLGCDFE